MTKIIYNKFNSNKTYRFGCVIPFYNREFFVKNTINSISDSFLPNDLLFIIIDDGSHPAIKIELNHDYILIQKDRNYGISNSLSIGWDIAYILGIEYMLNLDSDTNISTNWISRLLSISKKFNDNAIVTGFNGQYHKIITIDKECCIKKSIGGINIWFHKNIYSVVRPALTSYNIISESINEILNNINLYGTNPKIHKKYNGWDWGLVSLCKNKQIKLICANPSVVQHIGNHGLNSRPDNIEQSLDYKNICVPKIIHQLWKDENIPDHLLYMQSSVIQHNSEYEYIFWTDTKIESFVQTYYPSLFLFYNSFKYIIQKIDFIRLLILYHFGGIYIDIDSLCFGSLDDILKYPVSLINTKKHKAFSNYYPFILNNAFISTEKNNHFIKTIINNIIEYKDPVNYYDFSSFNPEYTAVLRSAGPLCLTESYINYKYKNLITLLDNSYYYGLEKSKNCNLEQIILLANNTIKTMDKYKLLHIHESSWWKKDGFAISPPKNKEIVYLNDEDKNFIKNTWYN
jgi:mannosyltransferase OCH1-like enzyme